MKLRLLCAAICVWITPVFAADENSLAPDAVKLVDEVAAYYKALPGASVEMSGGMVQIMPGQENQDLKFKGSLSISRPNLLSLKLDSDGGFLLVSDGKSVWAHVAELKQYMVDDAPAALEDLIRDNQQLGMMSGQIGPVMDFFRDDLKGVMLKDTTTLKIVGKETVNGVDCTHLHGEQAEMDWDVWFEAGDKPALRRYSFSPMRGILAQAPEEMKAELKGASIDITVNYSDWKFAGQPAAAFAFEPPKDAKKVAEFMAAEGDSDGEEEINGMKGKPAPDFTLDLLEGGKMTLAQHKGKDVVILDFWATWCGPCVRALPIVAEVAAAYKDKGVVFYAVNQQEEAGGVKKFLEAKKLTLSVAMDAKGDAAKLYNVTGIPQTVIVGKDGNVAAVHVGFRPSLKEDLSKELDAILK